MKLPLQIERQKLAREHKKKEDAATLEDINEQIRRTEDKLDMLKKEKHELFTTLKRVSSKTAVWNQRQEIENSSPKRTKHCS